MRGTVGSFVMLEQIPIVLYPGESVTLHPYGPVFALKITMIDKPGENPRWELDSSIQGTLQLNLINHHTFSLGGTNTENIILGSAPGKQLIMRYAFQPFGDDSNRTWLVTCIFGESNV